MLVLASFDVATAIGVGGLITGLVGAWALVRRMGPERDQLLITNANGILQIKDNLLATYRVEVDRCRAENEALKAENERLRAANDALVAQVGRRHADRD